MATFTMTPDLTTSNDWTVVGSSANQALASDDTASYITSDDSGSDCQVNFADPSVAEVDIDSITRYRIYIKGHVHQRGASGSDVSVTVAGSAVTVNLPNRGGPVEINTHNVTSPSYSDLEGLTFRANKQDGENNTKIVYAYVFVIYTAVAAAAADNATFFGANF